MLKFVMLVVRWFRAAIRLPSLRRVLLTALRKSFAIDNTMPQPGCWTVTQDDKPLSHSDYWLL